MFGSNDSKDSRRGSAGSSSGSGIQANNSLVSGTKIEGTIFAETDIRIDGTVVGTIYSKGKVVVGSSGVIEGDIECTNAVVEGKFSGKLVVGELLQVAENAVVEGDVSTGKLMVHSGSTFNVTCKMGAQRAKELRKEDKAPVELGQLTKVSNQ
jgi:cytoskeletal protein CcmA (bactofilin family)